MTKHYFCLILFNCSYQIKNCIYFKCKTFLVFIILKTFVHFSWGKYFKYLHLQFVGVYICGLLCSPLKSTCSLSQKEETKTIQSVWLLLCKLKLHSFFLYLWFSPSTYHSNGLNYFLSCLGRLVINFKTTAQH